MRRSDRVDTVGLDRFPLLGLSQGGPVAIAYAVRHPERVSHLILYGGYPVGWHQGPRRETHNGLLALMRAAAAATMGCMFAATSAADAWGQRSVPGRTKTTA